MIVSRSVSAQAAAKAGLMPLIRSEWRVIAVATAAAGVLAAGVWAVTPNRYVAEAVVALDTRKVQVITLESVMSRLPQDSPVVRTELDLIASRSMAERVVDRLGLAKADVDEQSEPWWRFWAPWALALRSSPPAVAQTPNAAAVDRLVSGLRVNNDGRSYTIFIYYASRDPIFAARVANAYAAAYLDHQIAVQTQATRKASDWLGGKVSELGVRLELSEEAVESFRRKAGLLETSGLTADAQRLSGINAELASARSQRAGAEARLAASRELASDGPQSASFTEALASPSIQSLRTREAELVRQIGEIETAGADMSADLPAQRTQLEAVRRQIDGEVALVVASLANEVQVARRKEKALEDETAKVEAAIARDSAARVELNRLQREAVANRNIYESFLNRYKQTIEQEGLAAAEATLLSNAEVPAQPASPKLLPMLAFGLAVGAGIGVLIARWRLAPRSEKEPGPVGDDDILPLQAMPWHAGARSR